MSNQSPIAWGLPLWGAKPGSSGSGTESGPPPPRQPPPQPKAARGSGFVAALVAIMVGLVVGFILLVAWVVAMASGPIDATNAFVAQLNAGRLGAAYASLCEETKLAYSLDDFKADMSATPSITSYTFASASVRSNQQTLVSGTIDIDHSPRATDFGLRQEGDTWKVCSYPLLQ